MGDGFDFQPVLAGDRVILSPATAADIDALYAVAADPLIWAMHPAADRCEAPVFRAFFEDALADEGGLVVRDAGSGDVIGFSRYSTRRAAPGEVEIGWTFLARSRWGTGTNAEMKALMLTHAFRYFGTVIFLIGEANLRSRRAVEKLGALLTDREVVAVMSGRPVRHVVYALDAPAS
jgi:RimJ/RimL family protein N-acetyltransferase